MVEMKTKTLVYLISRFSLLFKHLFICDTSIHFSVRVLQFQTATVKKEDDKNYA